MFKRIFSSNSSCKDNNSVPKKIVELEIQGDKINNFNKIEKLVMKNLRKKHVNEIESLIYAIDNLKTNHIYESKKLEDLNKKKDNLDSFLEDVKSEFIDKQNNDSNLVCPICLDNYVNVVLIPCGHLVCKNCLNDISKSECFKCRNYIRFTNDIFIK